MPSGLGRIIREVRTALGLSQELFAAHLRQVCKAETTGQTVSNWERGQVKLMRLVDFKNVYRVARPPERKALRDWLLEDDP